MILITLQVRLLPEHRDSALAAARKMSAQTLAEPGCADYRFWISTDDPNSILLLEQWADQASLDVHLTQPSMAEFGAALGPALDGGMAAVKYEVASSGPLF